MPIIFRMVFQIRVHGIGAASVETVGGSKQVLTILLNAAESTVAYTPAYTQAEANLHESAISHLEDTEAAYVNGDVILHGEVSVFLFERLRRMQHLLLVEEVIQVYMESV
jgi:hypothetical protein